MNRRLLLLLAGLLALGFYLDVRNAGESELQ
jgi:hypothetical protein